MAADRILGYVSVTGGSAPGRVGALRAVRPLAWRRVVVRSSGSPFVTATLVRFFVHDVIDRRRDRGASPCGLAQARNLLRAYRA